jgi:D-amino-acid oxidase
MLTAEDLNSFPGAKWGYELDAPLAEMSQYLPWLKSRAEGLNVMFLRRKLLSLRELVSEYDVVVNCTGLGARKLCSDDGLVGVRGQYVLIDGNSLTPQYYVGDDEHPDGMSYMIPRRDGVCVGGTEEYGVEDLSFNLDVQKLLERVSETSPWLRALSPENVRARYIGLRPYRAQGVRLEAERLDECILVHNYGHGGSGFSLSWGCAREVRELVRMSCEGESIA